MQVQNGVVVDGDLTFQGGFAQIVVTRDRLIGGLLRRVARKGPRPAERHVPAVRESLRWEAQVLSRLDHPNVVRFLHFEETRDGPTLSMEYVPGLTLQELQERSVEVFGEGLPAWVANDIVRQIARALRHVHERLHEDGRPLGFVHCDLKPQNVLVDAEGRVRILDFGSVFSSHAIAARFEGVRHDGSPEYQSPEQRLGRWRQLSPATDLYALGLLFYELLVHQRYPGDLEAVRSGHPEAWRLLGGLLQADPTQRLQRAQDVLEAMDRMSFGSERLSVLAQALVPGEAVLLPDADGELPRVDPPRVEPRRGWVLGASLVAGLCTLVAWHAHLQAGERPVAPPVEAPVAPAGALVVGPESDTPPEPPNNSQEGRLHGGLRPAPPTSPTTSPPAPPPAEPATGAPGRLRVWGTGEAVVLLDDVELSARVRGDGERVAAGDHRLEIRRPGQDPVTCSVRVSAERLTSCATCACETHAGE